MITRKSESYFDGTSHAVRVDLEMIYQRKNIQRPLDSTVRHHYALRQEFYKNYSMTTLCAHGKSLCVLIVRDISLQCYIGYNVSRGSDFIPNLLLRG